MTVMPLTKAALMTERVPAGAGKRERTRQALLEAAIRMLAERGLEGTSIDDLMRAAGMARGTFYNYFQTREALAVAVSNHIRETVYETVIDRIPAGYSAEEIVACTTYGFIRYGLQYPETGWALVRIGGSAHWVTGARFERAHSALQAVLPNGEPLLAGLIYIEGVALMVLRRLLEGTIDIAQADTILQLAWRGLGITPVRIPALIQLSRCFIESLGL
jgi:AcrR family transcriptional regulator